MQGNARIESFLAGLARMLPELRVRYADGEFQIVHMSAHPDCAFVAAVVRQAAEQFKVGLELREHACKKHGTPLCMWEGAVMLAGCGGSPPSP